VREARATGMDPDELHEAREDRYRKDAKRSIDRSHALDPAREQIMDALAGGLPRREFLRRAALIGAGVAGARYLSITPRAGAVAPRVVVVGGGLAGMTAAYRIYESKGWAPAVYEAQAQVGGRTRTIRGLSGDQYAEAGGGGINTADDEIQALAQEVGLWPLLDTWRNYPAGGFVYYFRGKRVPWSRLKDGIGANEDRLWRAWVEIGKRIPTYEKHTAAAVKYDGMTVADFLNHECPNGTNTLAGSYMSIEFGVDYGGRAADASALHAIVDQGGFWPKGLDERWAIPGGNDTLCHTLADDLPGGSVNLGHALVAISRSSDGSYRLTFDNGSLVDVVADRVVLAIPPPVMKKVDFSAAGFSRAKTRMFNEEKLGSNCKLNFQFSSSPWEAAGDAGDAVTDLVLGETWQANFLSASPSVFVMENNERYPGEPAHGAASSAVVSNTVSAIEELWPGAGGNLVPEQAYLDVWSNDPWAEGSYSYYPPHGFTTYGAVEKKREGNVHFAGEHTADYDERGYMDGAVASGERAAKEVTSY
jgi:monoamine oxidase